MNTHPFSWPRAVAYVALCYVITWAIALPMIARAQGWWPSVASYRLHYATAYAPLVAAIIVSAVAGGSPALRALLAKLVAWRGVKPWVWLVSLFALITVFAVTVLAMYLLRGTTVDFSLLGALNYLPNIGLLAWLFWILNSGLGEEAGWRGFLLPELLKRFSPLAAASIVAVIWIGWHVPFFFYLDTYMKLGWAMVPGFAAGIFCGSIVFTWLYLRSNGSALPAILFHGTLNFVTASKASEGVIAAVVSTAVVVWAIVLVIMRGKRL